MDWLSNIWKFNHPDKIKQKFFIVKAMSVQLYACTINTQMKCLEKKLDGNYKKDGAGCLK